MANTDNVVALPPRFKDFDEAAQSTDPITFKVRGRQYELQPDLPAATVWNMVRSGVDIKDPKQGVEFLEEIIGKANVDQMLDDGVSLPQLTNVIKWVSEQYGLSADGVGASNPT